MLYKVFFIIIYKSIYFNMETLFGSNKSLLYIRSFYKQTPLYVKHIC